MSKITSDAVSSSVESAAGKVFTQEASEGMGQLAGDTAGALVGSGVKGAENWAKEDDKK
ncbi:hypothetical protein [Catenovulum agarivorans]|uniref:hypothetical protein n=1 Tax=Catenovulum agarivorans TaxID=1172192 RepID=UPI0002DA019B|nr:hypothetical protein [Catenovulum agarivorans]